MVRAQIAPSADRDPYDIRIQLTSCAGSAGHEHDMDTGLARVCSTPPRQHYRGRPRHCPSVYSSWRDPGVFDGYRSPYDSEIRCDGAYGRAPPWMDSRRRISCAMGGHGHPHQPRARRVLRTRVPDGHVRGDVKAVQVQRGVRAREGTGAHRIACTNAHRTANSTVYAPCTTPSCHDTLEMEAPWKGA